MGFGTTRRGFMKAALAAAAFPAFGAEIGKKFTDGKVRLACIGIGHQGWNDIKMFEMSGLAKVAALCDTDLDGPQCVPALEFYPGVPRFRDFRKMFDAMEGKIDAVAVMTPDFSHFPALMAAIKRGLPVFSEKPLAHTFEECEILLAAARKYGVATQMGNQGHSGNNYTQFKHYVETGVFDLSKLSKMTAHMNNPRRWHKWGGKVSEYPKAEKLPKGLDWDTWLGTAAFHDFSRHYVQGEWRSWYDFGNGCLGDWGAHTMDTMHRFFDLGLPSEIAIRDVQGWNKFVFPLQDTLTFRFAAKGKRPAVDLEWYEGVTNLPELPAGYKRLGWGGDIPKGAGAEADKKRKLNPGKFFSFADGTCWQGGSHGSSLIRCDGEKAPEYPKAGTNHYENFLLAVMGREETRSPFEVSVPLSEVFCLGCIAQRLNRTLKFDPVSKTFPSDAEATALLKGTKGKPRAGWEEYYKI